MANGIASLAPQQDPMMMGAAPPQMPPQGAPEQDPEAILQQLVAQGINPEEVNAGTMSSIGEVDPQLAQEIMAGLQGLSGCGGKTGFS